MKLKEDEEKISFREYLAGEQTSEVKHEFVNGEVYAMTGASYRHNRVSGTLYGLLFSHLQTKGCTPLFSDQMVSNKENSFAYYPDILVFCGQPEFYDRDERALLNPQVIIEVLSPSTESNDMGYKAFHYREIESLQDYLIVWQDIPRAEHFYRKENGEWGVVSYRGIDAALQIRSINFSLALKDLYEGVL